MFQKAKISAAPVNDSALDTQLKALLTTASGVAGLSDWLALSIRNAEKDFEDAATKAVFEPEGRMEAVHRHGIIKGIELVYQRIETLRSTGK